MESSAGDRSPRVDPLPAPIRHRYICLSCQVSVGELTNEEAAEQRKNGHNLTPAGAPHRCQTVECCEQNAEPDEPDDACTNPNGHEWSFTGTAYGGDDASFMGEGRCYCVHCGADGDA